MVIQTQTLRVTRPRNFLLTAGWGLVCVALAIALVFKVADFSLFIRYVSAVTGWPSALSIVIAVAVVGTEGAVLALGLRKGGLARAAAVGAGLFSVFTVFHLVRVGLGDPLPCACFGTALQWPPVVFAGIDATLLAICLAVYGATRTAGSATPWNLRLLWALAGLALIGLEVRVLIPRVGGPSGDEARFAPLQASAMLSTTGFVHRASNMQRILFVFGDYECPFSRELLASPEWGRLSQDPKTTVMWKELPLTRLHPGAMRLALLSKAAALDERLPEFETTVLSGRLDGKSAEARFTRLPAQTREIAELEVQDDLRLAKQLRLDRTPTIVLVDANGAREIASLKALGEK